MAERTSYTEGTPSWVDLGTPDLEAAKRFYSGVFGWTYEGGGAEVGNYTNALRDGLPVAALAPQQDPSIPTRWTTYFASDDADRTAARIADAGGQVVVEPMDVMEFGRMLIAFDPSGAPFGVWQGRSHIGARRVNEHGAVTWNELHTREGADADRFYGSVFGHEQEPMGDGSFDYTLYKVGDRPIGGRNQLGDDAGTAPAGWLTYFAVDDPDAAVTAATAGGGTVLIPARDSEYGRMAVLVDPWGAPFAVIAASPEEPS
jgi:predicted enzyme related to lactoylglutathione lyase